MTDRRVLQHKLEVVPGDNGDSYDFRLMGQSSLSVSGSGREKDITRVFTLIKDWEEYD